MRCKNKRPLLFILSRYYMMTHKDLLVFKMIFFNSKKLISDRLIHMKLDFLGAWNPLKNIDFSHKFERSNDLPK